MSQTPPPPETCVVVVLFSTPLGGIVDCSARDCAAKVTRHAMQRTARGLVLLERPLYLCDEHSLDDAVTART